MELNLMSFDLVVDSLDIKVLVERRIENTSGSLIFALMH